LRSPIAHSEIEAVDLDGIERDQRHRVIASAIA
jgi:hypothetical protein